MTVEPSPRRSRWPIALVVVLVLAILIAVGATQGWLGGIGASPSTSPDASVPGVIAADADVVAEGRAVPVRFVELEVGAPGIVATVGAVEGARVVEGQLLLSLDQTAAFADVRQAEAAALAALATVTGAEASVAQAKAGATAARAAVSEARAALRAADAARDGLPGAASNAQERQANAQVDQAEAAVARAQAARAQADAAVDAAEAQVVAARADATRADAAVDAANAARAGLEITATFSGTVVSIEARVGDRVQPGTVLVRLADLSAWRFETSDLSETSVARVTKGAAVAITVDGIPDAEIAGTVESVGGYGASVQGDITFRVVVVPTGDVPDSLRWNMTVTMEITGRAPG